jgi:signal transduction histidine kinase/CheY-like chemotaxis protein
MAARFPWLIGAIVLSLVILGLILVVLYRSLGEGKRLARLVAEQTSTLMAASEEAKKASAEAMKAYAEAENASVEAINASLAKSRFIANMNHEMRTPMNVIVGLTDLLLEEAGVSGKTKETLQKINTAGNTLMGLISDVLDISKVEAGKLELTPVQYDVPSLLNDIITFNMIRAEDNPVTFKLDINDDLPCRLFGDDLRIKQILNNLLGNAFKFTREGNVTLQIRNEKLEMRNEEVPTSVFVTFTISDTGIGIREEDMAKLFTDYNQVDTRTNREIKGTGLGLSITKKLAEMMGGEISVESGYGKGTTFRVRIRQGFVTDRTIGKEITENLRGLRYTYRKKSVREKLLRPDLRYARVLVVDDFPTNLDVAAGMLRKYKLQVDCVTSGRAAVDLVAAGEPVYDAVFMDHMMPGMDGMEATALIRALGTEYAKNIPVIALTANAVAGNEQMFLDNGFNAFIPKPFNVMILDAVIRRWIRRMNNEQGIGNEQTGEPVFAGEILICEDNKMNREIICERLAGIGLKTVAAKNGKEGVEITVSRVQNGTKPFDLIFMDIHMPVMDGLEAATEIGKLNTGTPVIAMTPDNTHADREEYLAHGMSDCLNKPFTQEELSDCLTKYLKPQTGVTGHSSVNEKKHIREEDLRFEEDLKNKFIRIFVNNNKNKYNEIAKAVDSGDIKTAHRLVHSLKGNAGMIGKNSLQKAAGDVQNLLKEDNPNLESESCRLAMGVLKAELEAVLNNEHKSET